MIRISQAQEAMLLEWAGAITRMELEAGIEPSGYTIEIGVASGIGSSATAVNGDNRLELGEVDVMLESGLP